MRGWASYAFNSYKNTINPLNISFPLITIVIFTSVMFWSVVNDASNDGTSEFLQSLNLQNLRVIELPTNSGVCIARNIGISESIMPIIAFIDDDCEALEDWLIQLVTPFSDLSCGLVIGQTWYRNENYHPRFPERVVHNHNAALRLTSPRFDLIFAFIF